LKSYAGTSSTSITLKANWEINYSAIYKKVKISSKYLMRANSGNMVCMTKIKNGTSLNLDINVKYDFSKGTDGSDTLINVGPKKSAVSWASNSSNAQKCKITIDSATVKDVKNYSSKIKIKTVSKGSNHWKFKITNSSDKTLSGSYGLMGRSSNGAFAIESLEFELKPGKSKTYTSNYSYSNLSTKAFLLRRLYAN